MSSFFLVCFLVGLLLTVVSAVLGVLDGAGADMEWDLEAPPDSGQGPIGKPVTISPINFQTIVAFVMCFGGVGYLFTYFGWAGYLLAIPAAAASGLAGAWLIWILLRFLMKGETPIPIGSDRIIGVYGRLSIPIRAGGTGEMIYTLNGVRQVTAARSVSGEALSKGEEVVVLRYERGVAYVQPLNEGAAEEE